MEGGGWKDSASDACGYDWLRSCGVDPVTTRTETTRIEANRLPSSNERGEIDLAPLGVVPGSPIGDVR